MSNSMLSVALVLAALAGSAGSAHAQQRPAPAPLPLPASDPFDVVIGNHWKTRGPADQYAADQLFNGHARRTNVVFYQGEWYV